MEPTTGRIVLYTLTADNAARINAARTGQGCGIGNNVHEFDVVPLIIVRVWPDEGGPGIPGVNGQAILDGNDTLWVTSAYEDCCSAEKPATGSWKWTTRP